MWLSGYLTPQLSCERFKYKRMRSMRNPEIVRQLQCSLGCSVVTPERWPPVVQCCRVGWVGGAVVRAGQRIFNRVDGLVQRSPSGVAAVERPRRAHVTSEARLDRAMREKAALRLQQRDAIRAAAEARETKLRHIIFPEADPADGV
jgi:hypothetical protein